MEEHDSWHVYSWKGNDEWFVIIMYHLLSRFIGASDYWLILCIIYASVLIYIHFLFIVFQGKSHMSRPHVPCAIPKIWGDSPHMPRHIPTFPHPRNMPEHYLLCVFVKFTLKFKLDQLNGLTLLSIRYFKFSSCISIIKKTITGAAVPCPVSIQVEEASGSHKQLKLWAIETQARTCLA